ncbi:MAG: chorismate-binding protein, partial [Actinomycetota bacterium]|nr:chorismate-binding protein [Actinomycetota bacterium]
MKGTRRRHGRPEADAEAADALRHSQKDLAENVMIVDLLRNDLSRVSSPGGVSVPELFRVERYETVWQLTSTVAARLRPEVGLVDVFAATFPCGSITGAPKVSAMHLIERLETSPRGVYCGAIGMISPSTGGRPSSVWSVAIRTAVVDRSNHHVEFGAGGGITYDSVPADEDDELESKTAVLRSARAAFELFETLRIDEKGVHHLALHLHRLAGSARYFGFPWDTDAIARAVMAIAPDPGSRRLRIVLDRLGRFRLETQPLDEVAAMVMSTRPTAVNLFWGAERIKRVATDNADLPIDALKELVIQEALNMQAEDERRNRQIGKHGAELLGPDSRVLTHCNAGSLATAFFGTALGVIFTAHEQGKIAH